ncbi:argonaute-like protein [Mycena maculata]|uniref:Argonaute-like protein n=1 Tax=Mycena maculata TaxID=230809 RepID=A0AAD7JXY6_9AGAR|nr:argonaute-like protein [Mycena maculata]
MHPRGHGSGTAQAPTGTVRGRSSGRGRRGEGAQSADSSPHRHGTEDAARGRGRGPGGRSAGRGESLEPVRGSSRRGARRASSRGSRETSSMGSSRTRSPAPSQPQDITPIGVPRRGFGRLGTHRRIAANSFPTRIEGRRVYQYDVITSPDGFPRDKQPATALNMRVVRELQHIVAPHIFNPPAVYDGQRKLYALVELPLEDNTEFPVVLPGTSNAMVYTIRLKRAGETVDTEALNRFIDGTKSHSTDVINGLQVLNVALRMTPLSTLPSGKERRIFYTPSDTRALGFGVVVWRGYFQSLRPAISRLLVNVDVSSCVMYRPGPLIDLAREYLHPNDRRPAPLEHLLGHERDRLGRFITGIRVACDRVGAPAMERSIKELSNSRPDQETFTTRNGRSMTIAQYFTSTRNQNLRYPDLPCVQVGNVEAGRSVLVPIELCTVIPGQPLRMNLPPEIFQKRIEFGARPPAERLQLIKNGLQVLAHGQSEYVRQFGISVNTEVLYTDARVLFPPTLRYRAAQGNREESVASPRNGKWNMERQHFYKAAIVETWALVNYAPKRDLKGMIDQFVTCCRDLGIEFRQSDPTVTKHFDDRGNILQHLDKVEQDCVAKNGNSPTFFFVVLPTEADRSMYQCVKFWGDVKRGKVTQCMKEENCDISRPELWRNVAHKINVKLGGINVVIDSSGSTLPSGVPLLGRPNDGTMVMGADVTHPSTGGSNSTSYSALVSSVDSHASKYVATLHMKPDRQEIITDLQNMTMYLLTRYIWYRREKENVPAEHQPPKRIIFYRDGVDEGQFQKVVNDELPMIKRACSLLNMNPKITLVVVGKRHHMRFFDLERNHNNNCLSGTIIDRDVVHPTEFDFYLHSHGHGGVRGTSRPGHYSVLYDDNNLTPDSVEALSFALCHVYACSTRAVSIPAPVYYADRVCSRRSNHFNPKSSGPQVEMSEPKTSFSVGEDGFQEIHDVHKDLMYFV